MYPSDLRDRLAAALEPDPRVEPEPGDRLAAVLVPILADGTVLFTKRTEGLPRHSGEISFPGGVRHDDDASASDTALRETREELGVPPAQVELLGALPPVHTFVSSMLVVPFVGVLRPDAELDPEPGEVADVLRFGLRDLRDAEREVEWARDGGVYRGYAYEMGPHTIWGATARILHSMLELAGAPA